MASIWSDEGKLATWLAVEQAATAAWAEIGAVPEDAARRIAAATPPTPERVA
jgi:adenylosuccinate lyase